MHPCSTFCLFISISPSLASSVHLPLSLSLPPLSPSSFFLHPLVSIFLSRPLPPHSPSLAPILYKFSFLGFLFRLLPHNSNFSDLPCFCFVFVLVLVLVIKNFYYCYCSFIRSAYLRMGRDWRGLRCGYRLRTSTRSRKTRCEPPSSLLPPPSSIRLSQFSSIRLSQSSSIRLSLAAACRHAHGEQGVRSRGVGREGKSERSRSAEEKTEVKGAE